MDMAHGGTLTRLQKEYCYLLTKPIEGISAGPRIGERLFPHWDGYVHGPENSPYEKGIFKLSIELPTYYPFKPPKVVFVTKVVHCNIDHRGYLHLDILSYGWGPSLTIAKVLLSVRCLLTCPNPDDPLVPDLALLLKKNPNEYDRLVREATLQYAIPKPDSDSDEDC